MSSPLDRKGAEHDKPSRDCRQGTLRTSKAEVGHDAQGQVGPALISIHQGHAVLISKQDIGGQKGLYYFDRRIVRSWAICANGGAAFADLGHGSLLNQLPELYAAFARDGTTFRIHPRQRAAGLGGLIGCHTDRGSSWGSLPDAPRSKLYVRPSLPV
jgi:hypothetical protein